MASKRTHGFTLIELMVTGAIAAIVLTMAVPSFTGTLARMRMEGAINELSTDLQFARTHALRRNVAVTLTLNSSTQYTIAAGATNAKVVTLPTGITMTADNNTVNFDAMRGLVNAARAITASSTGTSAQLRVNVDVMGRVSICTPSGTFTGYSTCS
jgi:type IV fimbrial biogenesis protein FimT